MFRQAIVYLALFMVGMISSHDLLVPAMTKTEYFSVEVNGNLSIVSVINTNNEILHQQIDYEPLKLAEDVEGLIHYSIGARTSSEYGIFLKQILLYYSNEKEREWGSLRFRFFSIRFGYLCRKTVFQLNGGSSACA